MKKVVCIVIGLLILLTGLATYVVSTNQYPDNYLYDFEGVYNDNYITNIYEYETDLIVLMSNNEITNDVWDDDDCHDEMLQIVQVDSNFEVIKTTPIEETKTLHNDGKGVRFHEYQMQSYQYEEFIYISISLYEEAFMIIYKTTDYTYEIKDLESPLESFYIDETLQGVGYIEPSYNNLYGLVYFEYDLNMNLEKESLIGQLESNSYHPLINDKGIIVKGDFITHESDKTRVSVYKFESEEVTVQSYLDAYGLSYQFINESDIIYNAFYVSTGDSKGEFYNLDHELVETVYNNDFPTLEIDSNRFHLLYYDNDRINNKVRIYDSFDNEEIVLDFDMRVNVIDIYYYNDDLYLVVSFKENGIKTLINGEHENYIIKYSVEELKTK